jgi:NIPSNAP
MLYDLTLHLARPARFAELVRWHRTHAGNFAADSARFDGVWTCEFGVGNRIARLRAFADAAEWARACEPASRGQEHGTAPAPPCEYLEDTERRLLQPLRGLRSDLDLAAGLCDLRIYDVLPGSLRTFVEAMLAIMPLRERYSPNAGVWQPLTGSVHQLVHLWYYRTAADRAAARDAVIREPAWQDYRVTVLPLITHVQSCILTPLPGP